MKTFVKMEIEIIKLSTVSKEESNFVSGHISLKSPYVPNFSIIPAKSMEPIVGASPWASGSHAWNGTTGTLTKKESKAEMIKILWKKIVWEVKSLTWVKSKDLSDAKT